MSTPRPSWKGSIHFAGLKIPIELTAVCADPESEFVTVHAGDSGELTSFRRCGKCLRDIEAKDTARAIRVGDRCVIVTDDEIEACATSTRPGGAIDLTQFAPAGSVPNKFVERSYYVNPGSTLDYAVAAFAVLETTLLYGNMIAVGKVSFKTNDRIAMVGTDGSRLMLYTLHFPSEMRAVVDVPVRLAPNIHVNLALDYIRNVSAVSGRSSSDALDLSLFTDDYALRLAALLRGKRGEVLTEPAGPDLAEVLTRAARQPRKRRKASAVD